MPRHLAAPAWLHGLILALGLAAIPAAAQGNSPAADSNRRLLLQPRDRVMVQCAFVPHEGARRLYACLVGTLAGVHYAYDFETGSLLSVWRGTFADMTHMWVGAGFEQVGRPGAVETTLKARPLLAFFPGSNLTLPQAWPSVAEPLYQSLGYELERDGQPIFLSALEALTVRDRIAPLPDGAGLERQIRFSGRLSPWSTWLHVAESRSWVAQGAGHWRTSDNRFRIEWPSTAARQPVVHDAGDHQQLVLRIEAADLETPISYRLLW